jgi:hypothetical protein
MKLRKTFVNLLTDSSVSEVVCREEREKQLVVYLLLSHRSAILP